MNNIINAFVNLLSHFVRNFSNYSLLGGLLLVINFIFKKYGADIGLLSIGILLLCASFVLELSNINNKNRKR